MVTGFDATPADLQVCGAVLKTTSDDVHAELRTLAGEMDGLLGSWQGSAANGFSQGWDEWHQGTRDVLDALKTMGQLLSEAGANYLATDTSAADNLHERGRDL